MKMRLEVNVLFLIVISTAQAFSVSPSFQVSASLPASPGESLQLFSPCKVNLFLRILRKREDGYHDLASLFQAVGFGDDLTLKVLDGSETSDTFSCNMEGVPTDSTNLVLRALQLMREKTGQQMFFDATLIKNCPAQAGLGGGSANAATAMFGCNELMGKPARQDELIEWSAALGSDITFFLSQGTAYCTGRGEVLTPQPPVGPGTPVTICKPNVGLSTPTVFKSLNYDLLRHDLEPEMLLDDFKTAGILHATSYVNDLEPPAFANLPELNALKEELLEVDGFSHVLMSGSGTSIFCIGRPTDETAFQEKFGSRPDLQVFFSEFINRDDVDTWYERPSQP